MKAWQDMTPSEQAILRTMGREPSWQLRAREAIGLTPEMTDPVSRLLWGSVYGSESAEEATERIQNHIDELQRALIALEGIKD